MLPTPRRQNHRRTSKITSKTPHIAYGRNVNWYYDRGEDKFKCRRSLSVAVVAKANADKFKHRLSPLVDTATKTVTPQKKALPLQYYYNKYKDKFEVRPTSPTVMTENVTQHSLSLQEPTRQAAIYHSVQCDYDDGPLLPPSNFRKCPDYHRPSTCNDGCVQSKEEASRIVQRLKHGKASCGTHRKYVVGAFYEEIFDGCFMLDARNEGPLDLEVKLASGEVTTVKIDTACHEDVMLESIVQLGITMKNNGNVRDKSGDEGAMFGLGHRDFARDIIYMPMYEPGVSTAMAKVSRAVGTFMKETWPCEYNEIRHAELQKSSTTEPLLQMGGWTGPGHTMMLSRNLTNSAHLDIYDKSRSFAVWAEKAPGQAKNWFFVMPDVSIDGSTGVAIQLHHGCVISWDGRLVRHCTSKTDVGADNDNAVFACMFGSCG